MKKILILLVYFVCICCLVRAQSGQLECEKEGFAIVQSTNCGSYYYCFKSANNEFYPIEFKCPSDEEFSLLILKCIPKEENECGKLPETPVGPEDPTFSEEFVCPSQGRFPDVESLDCKSYYSCTADLIPTPNKCPSVSIFSWTLMKCVMPETFTCPNEIVTTTEVMTTEAATTETVTTEAATTETVTTEMATTTSNPESFVCVAEGRFPDPQTVDCKSYYLCAKTPSGSVAATLNQCPSTALFSPISSKCVTSENYVCPQTVSPTSTMEPSTTSTVETTEIVDSTTSSFVTDEMEQPSTTTIDTTIETEQPSEEITHSVSVTETEERSTTAYVTTTETTTEVVVTTEEPSVEETTLSTTISAETTSTADITSSEETTHSVSVTDTEQEQSTTANTMSTEVTTEIIVTTEEPVVKETTSTESNVEESTTDGITTKDPSVESFTCTARGRFPNPAASDCNSYYLCAENAEGILEATLNKCPSVTVFDPLKGKCVHSNEYQCIQGEGTTTHATGEPGTNEVTTQEPPTSEPFACPSAGRFPDPTSTDCKRYYLCTGTAEGTYEAVLTQCPTTTLFSVENKRCVLSSQYQCPINIPSTEPIDLTTTEAAISTTVPSTTTEKFVCRGVGRHPDTSQTDCSKYKYCLLTATNEFLEYTFYCPAGTYFDPTDLRCSMSYSCPPKVITTLAEPTTPKPFTCATGGRFSDSSSAGCEAYVMCLVTATGDILQYNFKCPSGSRFDPKQAKCETNYKCF
ncbi:AAEL013812-PA [Aedes aegypti]|uniref:AAEL013812-PA n=1 Tax=Aedes aegypti TaxID=7159 RepID=Q16I33_AEDAE|nr:AAEL013812-PA [Aedes aegypti]